jgi:hypothetical protein
MALTMPTKSAMNRAPMTSRRLGHADFIHLAARPVRLLVVRGTLWVTQDGEPHDIEIDAGGQLDFDGHSVLLRPDHANWNCRPIGVRHLEDLDVVKPKFTMRRMRCGTKRNWNGSSSVLHHLCALCVIGTAARGALGSCVLEIGRRQPMVTSTPRAHEPEAVLEPARRCLGRVTGRADVQPARRPRREWRRVRKRSPQRAVWHRFRDDPRGHPLLSDRAAGRCQGRPWHS